MSNQLTGCFRGNQACGRAGEQIDPHAAFQRLDAAARSGLGDTQQARSARQAACAQDREEGTLVFPMQSERVHTFPTSGTAILGNWFHPASTSCCTATLTDTSKEALHEDHRGMPLWRGELRCCYG